MGHLLLEINPEDAFDTQPLHGQRGMIVCAARLDNRDALLEAFHIPPPQVSETSDGHLVRLAFDRWGEEVCSHLEGDWAIAAWDKEKGRLYLARDVMGSATLYYHKCDGFVAFASSMKALLAVPGVPIEADLLYLAEVLVSWPNDADLTAYKGFRSVVGAHLLTFSASGQTYDRRFWSAEGREPFRFRSDEEYIEGFLEHYQRAVRNCLRPRKKLAMELSGGRDSGSFAVLAAPMLADQGRELAAFTSIPLYPPDGADETRLGNEWELAQATATMAGANVRHRAVDAAGYSVLDGLHYYLQIHDGPDHASANHFWSKAIMDECSRCEAGALLHAQMGNATISWEGTGSALLALAQGRPATARRLFFHAEASPWLTLKRQVIKPLVTPGRRTLRRLSSPHSPWLSYSAISPALAEKLDLRGRMRAAEFDPTFTTSPLKDAHADFFRFGYGTGSGIAAELAAWHSMECLDPAANLALLEYLLRVPDDQFYWNGRSSYLFQRAFKGRLPDAVVAGRRKGLQSADLGHRTLAELPQFRECLHSLDSLLEAREVLDLPLMHRCLDELVVKVNPETTYRAASILVRGIGVGLFLRQLAEGA
jgi:asparagine synthase (glutamine-hydrolysing)